jgi:hypothetical protein
MSAEIKSMVVAEPAAWLAEAELGPEYRGLPVYRALAPALRGQRRGISRGRSSHTAGYHPRVPVELADDPEAAPELLGEPYLKTSFHRGNFSKILYTPSTLYARVGKAWLDRALRQQLKTTVAEADQLLEAPEYTLDEVPQLADDAEWVYSLILDERDGLRPGDHLYLGVEQISGMTEDDLQRIPELRRRVITFKLQDAASRRAARREIRKFMCVNAHATRQNNPASKLGEWFIPASKLGAVPVVGKKLAQAHANDLATVRAALASRTRVAPVPLVAVASLNKLQAIVRRLDLDHVVERSSQRGSTPLLAMMAARQGSADLVLRGYHHRGNKIPVMWVLAPQEMHDKMLRELAAEEVRE